MVDHEVENTLREIRERVLAESRPRAEAQAPPPAGQSLMRDGANAERAAKDGPAVEALARLQANLATTERAWSRLPPLVSYRRGLPARVELWLKRQIKRAAHWFTWEQVNFNSAAHNALDAAHQALSDALAALAAHERALAAHERVLSDVRDALSRLQSDSDANAARVSELHARLASNVEQLRAELRAEQHALDGEQRAHAAELQNEMRERVESLLEEQRVCFRQLSLEAAEAAVMQDRARRQIEARLEELEKAVNRKP